VPGNYIDERPANQPPRYAPRQGYDEPHEMAYPQRAPRRRGVSGNMITTIFLLLGLFVLWMLIATDGWIEPLRSLFF
jgi:hypothetical protein